VAGFDFCTLADRTVFGKIDIRHCSREENWVILSTRITSIPMPITHLNGQTFDLETKRVMGVAFEMARAALRLEDRADPVVAILAHKIIELAKGGELSPDLLCERALNDLRAPPPHV
jgi:hypothetical protein